MKVKIKISFGIFILCARFIYKSTIYYAEQNNKKLNEYLLITGHDSDSSQIMKRKGQSNLSLMT